MVLFAETATTTTTTSTEENFFVHAWNQLVNHFTNNAWGVVIFFSVLVIGFIAIKIIIAIFKRIAKRHGVDGLVIRFLAAIIRFFLWLVLIIVLLSMVGISIGGIATAMSAIILAVGMALKEFLSNVASGMVLVGSKKYKQGNFISVGDVDGFIVDINFLFTTLKTRDGKQVTIPNNTMTQSAVTNYGAYPLRRVDITFSVAYESDCDLVVKIVTDVMKANGMIYLDPAPSCRLKGFSASALEFFSMCWCDGDDYWDVFYYLNESVYNEFKRHGITIPYTQIEMRERTEKVVMPFNAEPLPERVEKKRAVKKKTLMEFEDMSLKEIADTMDETNKSRAKEREAKKEARRKKKEEEKRKKAEEKARKAGLTVIYESPSEETNNSESDEKE